VKAITGELADIAEAAAAEARRVAVNARRWLRRAGAEATGKAKAAVAELERTAALVDQVVAQTRVRLAGEVPDGATRVMSLHDADARPIAKGHLGKPVEFGFKTQVLDNTDGIVLDHHVVMGNPPDAPMLVPVVERIKARFGRTALCSSLGRPGDGTARFRWWVRTVRRCELDDSPTPPGRRGHHGAGIRVRSWWLFPASDPRWGGPGSGPGSRSSRRRVTERRRIGCQALVCDNPTMATNKPDMRLTDNLDTVPDLGMLRKRRSEILAAASRHGASNVRVFGSVVRGRARPGTDIDLLVDMDAGRSLLDLAGLHLELEDILGFPVEIGTDVKPRIRDRVHAEAIRL